MQAPTSDYVPADLDATQWPALERLFTGLLERPVANKEQMERWLLDRSELEAACSEAEANLYIAMTCHTEDKAAQAAYTRFVETIPPKIKPLAFVLDRRQVELSARVGLEAGADAGSGRYMVLLRGTRADVELYREENVPIQTELTLLGQKYDQIAGAMTVQFEGREQTLPQMGRYQESTERGQREAAWRAVATRRLRDREAIDGIYDQMIGLRDTMGRNAGFSDFVGYAFKSKHRFDYGVEQCLAFHKACEQAVTPLVRRLDEQRARRLGVQPLRPWDLSVDEKGRPPLKPFDGGAELMRKSVRTFEVLDPRLAAMLSTLGDGTSSRGAAGGACLDLDTRKGKAPGGYQYMRDRIRKPFIFMNAAGLQRDVETMVHEAGHAFHSMLCEREPLLAYRHAPMEFCEVASMSMELLTMPHWGQGGFYEKSEDLARAQRQQLEHSFMLLPWIATIDAFQLWIYTHPRHTRDQRSAHWLELDDRFGRGVSWEGLEEIRACTWQRQSHLFGVPFYYIEYGIAQLGALQLWLHALEKGERSAIDAYTRALSLGGSRPLPELFAAAGLKFDFGPETVKRLVDRVEKELQKLPE
jgi:oligoendopeptidase F